MAATLPQQGTLNRALTAIMIPDFPELNVVAGYFASKMARISFDGVTTDNIPVQAGTVQSPRLFQVVTITAYLNKAQGLASQWENQRLTNSNLGPVNFITDSSTLEGYYLDNCALMNISDISATGEDADFPITITGTYFINGAIWG